ncbi:MAG: hypothetical protein JSS81_20465 [Acidobacteria bacterium]|nr:hypothetical protein [Acidobacteriota bacterium]
MSKKPYLFDTGWQFVTSRGLNLSLAIKSNGFSAGAGSIYLAPLSAPDNPYEFNYASAGICVGLASASLEFATKDIYSSGVVYGNPLIKGNLTLDDMQGACLIYSASAHILPGGSVSVILIGVGMGIVKGFFLAASGVGFPLAPLAVLASCRAMVFYSGGIIGTPDAGCTATIGYITNTDTMKNKNYGTIMLVKSLNSINQAL